MHLRFMRSIYRLQLREGRFFLHDHPQSAASWREPAMLKLLSEPDVDIAISHQCAYGLHVQGPDGVLDRRRHHPVVYALAFVTVFFVAIGSTTHIPKHVVSLSSSSPCLLPSRLASPRLEYDASRDATTRRGTTRQEQGSDTRLALHDSV